MVNKNTKSILDILLDEDNRDNITLEHESGELYEFEQVAVIPDNGKLYCILHPITKIEGVANDEAVVFNVTEEGIITVEEDELTILEIFDKYYELLEENRRKRK